MQDLQWDDIKSKHEDLFKHEIDLLIVDETHFWARWEEYWKILNEQNIGITDIIDAPDEDSSIEESNVIDDTINKVLNRKVTLHLSGTPYKILMGKEFDDIIQDMHNRFIESFDKDADRTSW